MYFLIAFLLLLLVAASIVTVLLLLSMAAFAWVRVPYVPTPASNVDPILTALGVAPGVRFYDLGCGDGRFVVAAAARGAKATGLEVSPWAYLKSCVRILLTKSRGTVLYKNFYQHSIADADIIFCFLLHSVMPAVERKLQAEARPGTLIGSYGFPFPTWKPVRVVQVPGLGKRPSTLYLYQR